MRTYIVNYATSLIVIMAYNQDEAKRLVTRKFGAKEFGFVRELTQSECVVVGEDGYITDNGWHE